MKPLIGVSSCTKHFGAFNMPNHAASDTYVRAVANVVGGVPLLFAADLKAADVATLVARLDGVILTGSRSNVHPDHYDGPPHPEGVPEDPARDAVTLPLIRAVVAHGVPLLAICRGMQELNVALGGSLHQRLQDLPGRLDHSAPLQPLYRLRFAKAHAVRATPGGWLHRVAGTREIAVNSLHNQGVDRLGRGLAVEGVAPDGVIESVRVAAAAFAVGVQWHPESDFERDVTSRRIFESFADAVRLRMAGSEAPAEYEAAD